MKRIANFNMYAIAVVGLLLMAFLPTAQAVILGPGGGVPGPGDPFVLAPSGLDTLVAETMPTPITFTTSIANLVHGKFKQQVFRNVAGESAVCLVGGCLDFFYQFSNDATSTDGVGRMTTIDFAGFVTDVGFSTTTLLLPGIPVQPFMAASSVDRSPAGTTVGFQFANVVGGLVVGTVLPGEDSQVLVIRTNGRFLTSGTTNIINGGVASIVTFAPTAVPEPASIVFLGTTLLCLTGVFRKKLQFKRS